jgi:hypothetical protein
LSARLALAKSVALTQPEAVLWHEPSGNVIMRCRRVTWVDARGRRDSGTGPSSR